MKYGRNKTKTMVVLKIMFVWVISMAICSPLGVYGFLDYTNVYNDGLCVPTIQDFVMYGSIFAFYVPLFIMVLTYTLTLRILCNNQKLMQRIASSHSNCAQMRKETNGGSRMYNSPYLRPPTSYVRYQRSPVTENGASRHAWSRENSTSFRPSTEFSNSFNRPSIDVSNAESSKREDSPKRHDEPLVPIVAENAEDVHSRKSNSVDSTLDENGDGQFQHTMLGESKTSPLRSTLSVSQPHLPSMGEKKETLPSSYSQRSLRMPHTSSVLQLESVQNFESMAGSLNSMLSGQNHWDSTVWSDFEEPEMFDKLSQIEAEMDECLSLKTSADRRLRKQPDREGSTSGRGVSASTVTSSTPSDSTESEVTDEHGGADRRLLHGTSSHINIPPVKISAPSGSNSDSSIGGSVSSEAEIVTLSLRPSGCYLYRVQYTRPDSTTSRSLSALPTRNDVNAVITRTASVRSACPRLRSQDSDDSTTPCLLSQESSGTGDSRDDTVERERDANANEKESSTDDGLSDGVSGTHSTLSSYYKNSPNMAVTDPASQSWNSFLKRRKARKIKRGQHHKQYISKRTASNEKKASKVLGIIFAVFVVLWTPFFTVNVLSVACELCMSAMTPAMMASIVWLGYLSSLANPIIYTMFNTSFRRAFYKILTCGYRHPMRSKPRSYMHDGVHLTNATHWGLINTSDTRRNTLTVTLKE